MSPIRFLVVGEAVLAVALGSALATPRSAHAEQQVVRLTGADFSGGAKDRFGTVHYGEQVNYVYARSTGPCSSLRATVTFARLPAEPMFLHVKARDDDGPARCDIEIVLNGETLFRGPNDFADDKWQVRKIAVPAGLLKVGDNELVIANREQSGQLGMPPWFMVASCLIAPQDYVWRPDITKDFFVTLPAAVRPLPEPLAPGQQPGFRVRGIKGWMWRPEQYVAEIPVLAEYKMNFLMNCYTNMCDVENFRWGDRRCNRWWEPLPEWKQEAYAEIVRTCQRHGVQFCFSMNPNICTNRIVDYDSAEDVELLWKHYSWMQSLGVKWFNISLDDITEGIDAAGQAKVVNEIFRRLRANDPNAQMVFCPTYYWGAGTGKDQQPYLEVLARQLHEDLYLFWTGDHVVGPVTRRAAETFRSITRHRMFLWDNYPVNDNWPAMHLAPVTGRDRDLCEIIEGYMSNSMCTQNQANRIPLLTCADYAYNPAAYDPARSIGQAILHLAESDEQRLALKDLVEAYPGMLIHGQGPSFNAVREQYQRLAAVPHSRFASVGFVRELERLSARLDQAFPDRFGPAKETLAGDIAWLKDALRGRYGEGAPE